MLICYSVFKYVLMFLRPVGSKRLLRRRALMSKKKFFCLKYVCLLICLYVLMFFCLKNMLICYYVFIMSLCSSV